MCYLFGLLPACEQQAALMLRLTQTLNQPAIMFIALAILPGVLVWLQDGLDVVQNQQAAMNLQIADKQRYLIVYIFWLVDRLLSRNELETLADDLLGRWSILQRSPENSVKISFYLLDQ